MMNIKDMMDLSSVMNMLFVFVFSFFPSFQFVLTDHVKRSFDFNGTNKHVL